MHGAARGPQSSMLYPVIGGPAEPDHARPSEQYEENEHKSEDRLRYPEIRREERRHDALDERDERGPDDRPAERSRATHENGDERADRVRESGVLGRNEASRVRRKRACDPGDRAGDNERGKAKARGVIAQRAHPALVLANTAERSPIWRPPETPDDERGEYERDRHEHVHEVGCAEVEARQHRAADARKPVRTASQRRPLERDRED